MNDIYSKVVLGVIAISLSVLAIKNLDIIGSANAVVDFKPNPYGITEDAKPMVGEIKMFAGDFLPSGWAFCDGREVKIEHYRDLFNVIGGIYGAGDGEETFNLPDLRGRSAVGVGYNEKIREVELGEGRIYFANVNKQAKTAVNKASLGTVTKQNAMTKQLKYRPSEIYHTGDLGVNYIICWKGVVPE